MTDAPTNDHGLSVSRSNDFEDWEWGDVTIPENIIEKISISAAEFVTDEICEKSWMDMDVDTETGEILVNFLALEAELMLTAKFTDLVDEWVSRHVAQSGDNPGRFWDDDEDAIAAAHNMIKALEKALAKVRAVLS